MPVYITDIALAVYTPWNSYDVWLHHSIYIKTHDSESRDQEEAGRT